MKEGANGSSAGLLELPESPFLGLTEAPREEAPSSQLGFVETPFLTEYRLGGEVVDREATAARQLLAELFDTEFEESLDELLAEAEAEAERLGMDETPAGDARAERLLERWIEPLRLESEAMLERMATALDGEDLTAIGETELETLLDTFEPRETGLSPTFEGFLGKVWRKAKKAVSGAVSLVKKGVAAVSKILPIGMILRKLGKLVRPLLRRVVKFALNKLPPALRPHAARLAKRFLGELESLDELDTETATPAAADARHLQLGFDAEIATLLLAPSDVEMEDLLAESGATEAEDESTLAELDEARAQFIERFANLEQGENPTPLVEEFLPAIVPLVRLGIGIAGRPKVVRFLAGYLGRLISPYVGPQITPALSRAIVDAGLRLMTLETENDEAGPRLSAEAFANALEDTVRHVAQLSEDEWEDELALEEAAYEGFHEAVAGAFPSGLLNPESEYLETARPRGTWVAMPRRRRARYRKYSRVFPVTITPQVARSIRTFGGRTLASAVGAQLGRGGVIRGRIHLYQAVPGSRIGRILRAEGRAAAFSRALPVSRGSMHPLTRETAAMLVGEPGLGGELEEAYLERPEPLALGERLFYLELPTTQPAGAKVASDARLTVDLPANELKVVITLSESDAQGIAARLRRKEPLGASLVALRQVYRAAIQRAIAGPRGRLQLVREEPESEELSGRVVRLARTPGQVLGRAVERWVRRAIGAALVRQSDAFVQATAAEADGVTIVVRIQNPPGLRAVAPLLDGRPGTGTGAIRSVVALRSLLRGRPQSAVTIAPGAGGASGG